MHVNDVNGIKHTSTHAHAHAGVKRYFNIVYTVYQVTGGQQGALFLCF